MLRLAMGQKDSLVTGSQDNLCAVPMLTIRTTSLWLRLFGQQESIEKGVPRLGGAFPGTHANVVTHNRIDAVGDWCTRPSQ